MNIEAIGISEPLLKEIRHSVIHRGADKFFELLRSLIEPEIFTSFESEQTPQRINKCVFHILTKKTEPEFLQDIVNSREVPKVNITTEYFQQLLSVVCGEFNISSHELLYGKSKIREKSIAFAVLTDFLCDVRRVPEKQVAVMLNRSESCVTKYQYIFPNIDRGRPLEKIWADRYETTKSKLINIPYNV